MARLLLTRRLSVGLRCFDAMFLASMARLRSRVLSWAFRSASAGWRASHHSRCVAFLAANLTCTFALPNRPPWSLSLHPGRLAWLT